MFESELDLEETRLEDVVETGFEDVVKIRHMAELFLGLSVQVL